MLLISQLFLLISFPLFPPSLSTDNVSSVRPLLCNPLLHRHCPISTVLWDCPTTYHSFEILRFQLQFHTLLREMAGSPQLMCIHNVKHDWFSDSAVPHNTRDIALHDIVFRTS